MDLSGQGFGPPCLIQRLGKLFVECITNRKEHRYDEKFQFLLTPAPEVVDQKHVEIGGSIKSGLSERKCPINFLCSKPYQTLIFAKQTAVCGLPVCRLDGEAPTLGRRGPLICRLSISSCDVIQEGSVWVYWTGGRTQNS